MNTPKIVIIEDEKFLSDMYSKKLRLEGYDVHVASDGSAGIALALKERPDLIFLDVMMPNMNGIELLAHLNRYPELEHTKIVVLTNTDSPQTDEEVRRLGVVDYLLKTNMTPEELARRVKGYLGLA